MDDDSKGEDGGSEISTEVVERSSSSAPIESNHSSEVQNSSSVGQSSTEPVSSSNYSSSSSGEKPSSSSKEEFVVSSSWVKGYKIGEGADSVRTLFESTDSSVHVVYGSYLGFYPKFPEAEGECPKALDSLYASFSPADTMGLSKLEILEWSESRARYLIAECGRYTLQASSSIGMIALTTNSIGGFLDRGPFYTWNETKHGGLIVADSLKAKDGNSAMMVVVTYEELHDTLETSWCFNSNGNCDYVSPTIGHTIPQQYDYCSKIVFGAVQDDIDSGNWIIDDPNSGLQVPVYSNRLVLDSMGILKNCYYNRNMVEDHEPPSTLMTTVYWGQ